MENELEFINKLNEYTSYLRSILEDTSLTEFYSQIYPEYSKLSYLDGLRSKNFAFYILKDKFDRAFNLIKTLEYFDIDMSKVRKNINEKINTMSSFSMWFELDEMCYNLNNEYKNLIEFKRILEYFENKINERINTDKISSCVTEYLEKLSELKKSEIFENDYFSKHIHEFYLIGYELMKLEYARLGSSKLLDVFKENSSDYWYINKFVTNNYERLTNSINDVPALSELTKIIEKKNRELDDDFLEEKILMLLSYSTYPIEYKKMIYNKLTAFLEQIENLRNSSKKIEETDLFFEMFEGKIGLGKLITGSFSNQIELIKINSKYSEISKNVDKLMRDNNFLFSNNSLDDINLLALKIKNYFTIKY